MILSDVLKNVDFSGSIINDSEVLDIVYDSRKAKDGVIFVCLSGAMADGHKFARSAYDNGARIFLAEKDIDLPDDAQVFKTDNTRAVLSKISANFFSHPSKELTVIGITGTKGKTSTTFLTHDMLNAHGVPTGMIGTVGAKFGDFEEETSNTTPESYEVQRIFRKMIERGCKAVVMEVSSLGLKHHRVDDVEFDIGVFTNFSPDHIGTNEHESLEEYAYWKSTLFEKCKYAVLNIDDEANSYMTANSDCQKVTFGINDKADVFAENIILLKKKAILGTSFKMNVFGENFDVETSIPGVYNVYNVLTAVGILKVLNCFDEKSLKIISKATIKGRGEIVEVPRDFSVIIDYAHNGISFKSIFETLLAYEPNRLICVYGSVGGRTESRRREMGLVAGSMCSLSVLTSDDPNFEDPKKITSEIAQAVTEAGGEYVEITDREEAIKYALSIMTTNDILVIAGKGHENSISIKGEKIPLNEKQIVIDYLNKN